MAAFCHKEDGPVVRMDGAPFCNVQLSVKVHCWDTLGVLPCCAVIWCLEQLGHEIQL